MPNKKNDDASLYRPVLSEAWQIAWRRKGLWIFGLFASLAIGGGVYDVLLRGWNDALGARLAAALPPEVTIPSLGDSFGAITGAAPSLPPALLITLLIVLAVFAVLIWLSVVSQGALIAAANTGLRRPAPALKASFRAGLRSFWLVLVTDILYKFLLGGLVGLIALAAGRLLLDVSTQNVILYAAAFLIAVPLALVVTLLSLYTLSGIVIMNDGLPAAIRAAWQTFIRHWLISLEMAAIILLIDLAAAVALGIALLVLLVPVTLLLQAVQLSGSLAGAYAVMTISAVALLALLFVVGGALTAFRYACWTRLYLRLAERGGVAKLVRVLRSIPSWLHAK